MSALLGYAACFFGWHRYRPMRRVVEDIHGRPKRIEYYAACTRCRVIRLPINTEELA